MYIDDTMSDHAMPLASYQMVDDMILDDMVAMTFMMMKFVSSIPDKYGLFHKDSDIRSLTKLFTNVANEQGCVKF